MKKYRAQQAARSSSSLNLLALPNKAARMLQGRMARYSLRRQKQILIAYCLVAFGTSAGISYWSITHTGTSGMQQMQIRMPTPFPVDKGEPVVTLEEYQRIRQWRLYLDSVSGSKYSALQVPRSRQGWTLRDTLLYLEQAFHQQLK